MTATRAPRKARSEDSPAYAVSRNETQVAEDATIAEALAILSRRMRSPGPAMSGPAAVREYLRLKLAEQEREIFVAVFLDAQNRVIDCVELFAGTITQTSVYPREVVKAALAHNAAAAIFAHNHPSGVAEPSRADEALTQELKRALNLVDVRVLDHFIVAGTSAPLSFAERNLL